MNFWHMQMHQENSPVGIEKDILIKRGVIGLASWETEEAGQQEAFKSKMKEGDIVAIKHGVELIALVKVDGDYYEVTDDEEFDWLVRRRSVKILDWYRPELALKVSPRGTLIRCDQGGDAESTKSIMKWYELIQSGKMKNEAVELLKCKKQIILQGPPGTGKTRLAKEIAQTLTTKKNKIDEIEIKKLIHPGLVIPSSSDYTNYTVLAVSDAWVQVQLKNTGSDYKISFKDIQKAFQVKLWEGGQKNGSDPYAAAIAKYIFKNQLSELGEFKLIQFHPAYSYEDFVRGIVVDSADGIVSYRSVDRVFAEMAQKAWQNYQDSKKSPEQLSKEQEVDKYMELFRDHLEDQIEAHEGKLLLEGTTTYLFQVEEDAVRYTGDNWKLTTGQRLLFSDIKTLFLSGANSRKDVKSNPAVSGLAKQHSSYFVRVLNLFKEFVQGQSVSNIEKNTIVEQNFVLIIDEINRANLPSVLGELIYGLEYRGEPVESMYAVDGSRTMVVPPNLFVIGTMNTADRSVGHIDYAIRRRFAFVEVPPSSQAIHEVVVDAAVRERALGLFESVSNIFKSNQYLNSDFKANEVQLGHSYFLAETMETLRLKLEYEIKPLLQEYIKDGILNSSAEEEVKKLTV